MDLEDSAYFILRNRILRGEATPGAVARHCKWLLVTLFNVVHVAEEGWEQEFNDYWFKLCAEVEKIEAFESLAISHGWRSTTITAPADQVANDE